MDQVDVWEETAMELEQEERVKFWADKLSDLCEYISHEIRLKTFMELLNMIEKVNFKYKAVSNVQ